MIGFALTGFHLALRAHAPKSRQIGKHFSVRFGVIHAVNSTKTNRTGSANTGAFFVPKNKSHQQE